MPFDILTRSVLEHFTMHPPPTEDRWYGPWTSILSTVFPSTQGYMITHWQLEGDDPESDFAIGVMKLITPPVTFQTVLIVKVKSAQHWQSGIAALQRQLNRQTDAALAGTHTKVYWIEAIGPHWRYGEKEDNGQDLQPLIDWHDITHDQASFDDLQILVGLVAAM